MSGLIEALEGRSLFAVDVSLAFAPLMTDIPRYIDPGVITKSNSVVIVSKSADSPPKGQKPADVKLVLRPNSGGADIQIGVIKGSVISGIKGAGSKLAKVALTIPKTVAEGDYTLTATFDGTSIGDPVPANNTSIIFNTSTTITSNPPSPMATYGFGARMTFKKTGKGDGNVIAGTVHELGTFTDSAGHSGTYDVVIQGPRIPLPGIFDLETNQHTEEFFMTFTKRQTSLNGKTLLFTAAQTKDSIGTVYQLGEGVIYFQLKK